MILIVENQSFFADRCSSSICSLFSNHFFYITFDSDRYEIFLFEGIFWKFQEMYGIFSSRTYDSLDPQDESFIKDYEKFKTRTFELVNFFQVQLDQILIL